MPFFNSASGSGFLDRPLDSVPSASVAYALYKLKAAYTGKAIKVTKSGDTTGVDIGFDANGNLDTATLLSYAAGGTAYVKTWYDQSGAGADVTQATQANQPRIVNAGVLDTLPNSGGRPGIYFDGNAKTLSATTPTLPTGSANRTIQCVYNLPNFSQGYNRGVVSYGTFGTVLAFCCVERDTYFDPILSTSNGVYPYSGTYWDSDATKIVTMKYDGTNINYFVNGAQARYQAAALATTAGTNLNIGGHDGSYYLKGYLAEVTIWPSNVSLTDQYHVESVKSSYYGILPRYYFMDGDSLTYGQGASNFGMSWPSQFRDLFSASAQITTVNLGVPAATILARDTAAAATYGIDLMKPATTGQRTLIIWAGTNDIAGAVTPANTYTRLVNYVTARKATGLWNRIAVVTAIPRADTSTTTNLFSLNTLIRAGMSGGSLASAGATHLIDLNTDPAYDADGDYNDTTYYDPDKIHQKDAGYAKIAGIVKKGLGD